MRAFSITDIGLKRTINQDYVFCSENAVGNLPNLFIVADGMGGHKAGDFASKYTVDTLVKYIRDHEEENPIKIIREGMCIRDRLWAVPGNNTKRVKQSGCKREDGNCRDKERFCFND